MELFADVLEGVVGRQVFGNEHVGSALSEAGDAVSGGCLGIIMSGLFLFVGFFILIALFSGGFIFRGTTYTLSFWAFPAVLVLFASGVFSPFFGVLVGVRIGNYRIISHILYFLLYNILIIGYVALVSFGLPF